MACRQCGLPLDYPTGSDDSVCGSCLHHPPAFDETLAPFLYDTPLKPLIQGVKFGHNLYYARMLGDSLVRELSRLQKPLCGIVIPIPLHSQRLRERGFNQSLQILKGGESSDRGFNIENEWCRRDLSTQKQSQLSALERQKNICGAFKVVYAGEMPKEVTIFDDVVTTGATANEMARILKQSGVKRVRVVAVARALIHASGR